MFIHDCENSTHINYAITVGLQEVDRSASNWRNPQHFCRICVPNKMLVPVHLSGMKEWDDLVCHWVEGFGFGVFVVVAGLAGEGKIF